MNISNQHMIMAVLAIGLIACMRSRSTNPAVVGAQVPAQVAPQEGSDPNRMLKIVGAVVVGYMIYSFMNSRRSNNSPNDGEDEEDQNNQ